MNEEILDWLDWYQSAQETLSGSENVMKEINRTQALMFIRRSPAGPQKEFKFDSLSPAYVLAKLRVFMVTHLIELTTTNLRTDFKEYGEELVNLYGFDFDDSIIDEEYMGSVWSDRIAKHTFQLERDVNAITYAVLFAKLNQRTARSRLKDRFSTYLGKIENILVTEKTRMLAEYIQSNVSNDKKFIFRANKEACGKCTPHDGKVFSVSEVSKYFPEHVACRCTLELIESGD